MATEWNLPYKTETWETPLYQYYIDQARVQLGRGNVTLQEFYLNKATTLKPKLIAAEKEEKEKAERTFDAIIYSIENGEVPMELWRNFIENLNLSTAATAAKAAFSPVVLIVIAGVIFYFYKVRK